MERCGNFISSRRRCWLHCEIEILNPTQFTPIVLLHFEGVLNTWLSSANSTLARLTLM